MVIRSVLITGGGSGLGAALAIELARRGCRVLVTGRRTGALEAVARQSTNIQALTADVTGADDQAMLAKAFSKLPAPRAIFHGAGYFQIGKLDTLSIVDWQRSFDTNVTARWALSTKCEPHLKGGRVLFVGSDSGRNVRVGGAAYSVAQAASETLRRSLQAEWADNDIAVAGFKPGLVDTDLVRGFLSLSDQDFPARPEFQDYIDRGECSTPDTIAAFAAWLLLEVDGGRFRSTDWDIRDTGHHDEWLREPLYK